MLLLLAVDHIVNSLDYVKVVCAAFLDLRKAYDSLDHCTLQRRIGELGLPSQYQNQQQTPDTSHFTVTCKSFHTSCRLQIISTRFVSNVDQ